MRTQPHAIAVGCLMALSGIALGSGCSADPSGAEPTVSGALGLDCTSDHPMHREFARSGMPGPNSHGDASADPREPVVVGLAFMGGPYATYSQETPDLATILDILDERNIDATFFFEEKTARSIDDGSPWQSPGYAAAFRRLADRTAGRSGPGANLPHHLVAPFEAGFPVDGAEADLETFGEHLASAEDELARANMLSPESLSLFSSLFPAVPCDATYQAQTLLDRSLIGWHASATASLTPVANAAGVRYWRTAEEWAKSATASDRFYSTDWWFDRGLHGIVVAIDLGTLYRRAAYAEADGKYHYDSSLESDQSIVRAYLEAFLDALAADETYNVGFTTLANPEFPIYHDRSVVRLDGSPRTVEAGLDLPPEAAERNLMAAACENCDAIGVTQFRIATDEVADGDRVFMHAAISHPRPENLFVTVYRNADYSNYPDGVIHDGAWRVDLGDGEGNGQFHDLAIRVERSEDGSPAIIHIDGALDRNVAPATYMLEVMDFAVGESGRLLDFNITTTRAPLIGGAQPVGTEPPGTDEGGTEPPGTDEGGTGTDG